MRFRKVVALSLSEETVSILNSYKNKSRAADKALIYWQRVIESLERGDDPDNLYGQVADLIKEYQNHCT